MLSKLRRPEYVFLLIAIPFYLILFIILPPVAGFDENTHAVRIEQLSEFNLFSDFIGYADANNQTDDQKFYGGSINANYWKFIDDWFNSTHLKLERYRLENVPELYDQSFATPEVVNVVFSNTAVFSPLVYFPYIIGFIVGRLCTNSCFAIYKMQVLVCILFYIILSFQTIKTIPYGKWAVLALTLNHNIFVNRMFLTADTMTFSVILYYTAQVLYIAHKSQKETTSTRDWLILIVLSVFLSAIKPTYLPIVMVPILIQIIGTSKHRLAWSVSSVVICLSIFAVWFVVAVKPVNTGVMWGVETHPVDQVKYIIAHPAQFIKMSIDLLDFDLVMQVPGVSPIVAYRSTMPDSYPYLLDSYIICHAILFISILIFNKNDYEAFNNRSSYLITSILMFLVAFFSLVLIYAALYISFTPVGAATIDGINPRYYEPVAYYLLISICSLLCYVIRLIRDHGLFDGIKDREHKTLSYAAKYCSTVLKATLVILLVAQLVLLCIFVYYSCYVG